MSEARRDYSGHCEKHKVNFVEGDMCNRCYIEKYLPKQTIAPPLGFNAAETEALRAAIEVFRLIDIDTGSVADADGHYMRWHQFMIEAGVEDKTAFLAKLGIVE